MPNTPQAGEFSFYKAPPPHDAVVVEARSFAQVLAQVQWWLQNSYERRMETVYFTSPFLKMVADEMTPPELPPRGALTWVRDDEHRCRARCLQVPNLVVQA